MKHFNILKIKIENVGGAIGATDLDEEVVLFLVYMIALLNINFSFYIWRFKYQKLTQGTVVRVHF